MMAVATSTNNMSTRGHAQRRRPLQNLPFRHRDTSTWCDYVHEHKWGDVLSVGVEHSGFKLYS